MDRGLYGPDTITWRLLRERALLLGGPRALLLQLAHPLVAAGVAEHSSFPRDALTRLRRTLDATLTIVYGSADRARAAAERVNTVHAHVHGTLRDAVGPYPAGTPYDARNPELLLWVHATLVDTSLTVYRTFVAPLSPRELERAWQESKIAARLLLVPDHVMPDSYEEFRAYFESMLTSGAIAIGERQRALARDVLRPPIRGVPRRTFDIPAAITIALLPEPVRRAYGFDARALRWSPRLVGAALRLLPARARLMRAARIA